MRCQQAQNHQEHRFKDFYELSALVLNTIRSPPPPVDFSDQNPAMHRRRMSGPSFEQMTPSGFAALLLGISFVIDAVWVADFLIGFVLMPWVLGLVIFFYFVGVVSSILMIGRAVLSWKSAPPSPRKDAASWKLL